MFLRFDQARSGRPVCSKTVSGGARSGNFRVDFLGSRVFPDHVARSSISLYFLSNEMGDSADAIE